MCSPGLNLVDDDYRMRKVVVVHGSSNCNVQQLAALSQELCNKMASPTTLYIILVWVLRIIGFLLSIAKWILVWFFTCLLRWCLHAIREGFKRYLGAAFLGSVVTKESRLRLTYYNVDEVNSSAERWNPEPTTSRNDRKPSKSSSVHSKHATIPESPLLPVVLEDWKSVFEDNSDIEDRERLVYEYTKVVAPQVSAFQLGEIVVPLRDTRQLVTFLKSKLIETCRWQPMNSDYLIAEICHLIMNLGLSSDNNAATADDEALPPSESTTSSLVELSAGATLSARCNTDNHGNGENDNIIQHAMIYMAAAKAAGRLHLVLVGHKVDGFSGSSEFRSWYNPPTTQREKQEWQAWNSAHLRALKESVVETAQQLLTVTPIAAQVW